MAKLFVTEQASIISGTAIKTKFNDGSSLTVYGTGFKQYRTGKSKTGLTRALYPETAGKKCAEMDALAAAGIQ